MRAICKVQLKTGRVMDMMQMLSWNEAIGQFAMANSVCWYGHVLKKGMIIF